MRAPFLALMLLYALPFIGQVPIGQWREHLPYGQAINVTESIDKIWCATPYSVFSIDKDENSIDRWSKINGLSETGISSIAARPDRNSIIISYSNSNIDIIKNGIVKNINAIKNSTQTGDKRIFSINYQDHNTYLSSGIGIIVIDPDKLEVKDSYIIGDGGSKIAVFETNVFENFLYAGTEQGLKRAALNNVNLADYRNWQTVSGSNGLPAGSVSKLSRLNNQLLVVKADSIYTYDGINWQFFYADGWNINSVVSTGSSIILSESRNSEGRILVLSSVGQIQQVIQQPQFIQLPKQTIGSNNVFWIADSSRGLSKYSASVFQPYIPNSPFSIADGQMAIKNEQLWVGAGSVDNNWQNRNNKNGVYFYSNNEWVNFNLQNTASLDSLADIIAVAIDPTNKGVWLGSFGGGLFTLDNNKNIVVYKQTSPIQPSVSSPGSYRVSGLAFDAEGNLWISNYGANQNLHVRKKEGSWQSFTIPFPLAENATGEIIIDDLNQKWISAPNGQGLICFNHGSSIENSNDDRWKWFRTGVGNGNLPNNDVLSIISDKNSFIWIGTKRGIGIVQCPQEIFTSQGCETILPIVQQDNFAGYLFRDEEVQCMAVDGADRKWIGTKNGVWLISADAEKTIYRFNSSNSPLPDNDVKKIAVDHKTGEVFFSTSTGMVSFRSTATETIVAKQDVIVFPNPVPAGYKGTIGIRGLPNNSIVKIIEPDGRLVFQTRALGGQAVWNGKNYKGQTISSGVYLVLATTENKQEKVVSKIVFINK